MAKASARKTLNKPSKLGDLPEWNLKDLYPALDSPEVKQDLDLADSECAAFEQDFKGRLAALAAGEGGGLAERVDASRRCLRARAGGVRKRWRATRRSMTGSAA